MKRIMDTIKFDNRAELVDIIRALDAITAPSDTVKQLLRLLDRMDMEW